MCFLMYHAFGCLPKAEILYGPFCGALCWKVSVLPKNLCYFLLVRQQIKSLYRAEFCLLQLFPRYISAGELCQLGGLAIAFALQSTVSSLPKTQQLANILLYSLRSCSLDVWIYFGHSTPFALSLLFPFFWKWKNILGLYSWLYVHVTAALNSDIFIYFHPV